jgi:hypothetical protein
MFDEWPHVVFVGDCTYVYTDQPHLQELKRALWSNMKYTHLCKVFVIICPDQWICAVTGPYSADSKASDANILIELCNRKEFKDFFKSDDQIMLDRGFQGTHNMPEGVEIVMPKFLNGGSQYSTESSNESRRVTAFRWVIETTNKRIKEWQELEFMDLKSIPKLMSVLKVVCCILNRRLELHPIKDMV